MRLVFLGTGSGGSIQRFHTCIYVELADNRILLDASSGNSALVNASKLGLDLNTIHHLLLSHSHHDHSRGLEYLESHRNVRDIQQALNVYGSDTALKDVRNFFKAMNKDFEINDEGILRQGKSFTIKWNSVHEGDSNKIGDMLFKSHAAKHIVGAVGWRLECGNESVVFSGDTEFTENTIVGAKNADVLIHEAYGLKEDADRLKMVKHSSAYDAGFVAFKADVKQLVITHVSTDYHGKEDLLINEASEIYKGPISVAHDLMDLSI